MKIEPLTGARNARTALRERVREAILKMWPHRDNDALRHGTGTCSDGVLAVRELEEVGEAVRRLRVVASAAERRADQLLASIQEEVNDRACLAAITRAKLLSTSIVLEGSPTERLRVRRLRVGELVQRPFRRSVGVTRCESEAADVRQLWDRLIDTERVAGGDVLRGLPSTILDVPGAAASARDGALRISVDGRSRDTAQDVAIPRFTYDCAPRKLRNFGHWLLDCLPQTVALASVAPHALFLLPDRPKPFHLATLALMGIKADQLVPWNGSPFECRRLLAFESDGRTGGGRPLSPLMQVRGLVEPRVETASVQCHRRVYVSRRDARARRRWVTNEADVEALFRSRGFEIMVMADCPLEQQVRMFREARIVAGVSGAGLANLVFAPPGIDVVVLLSDTLIRWWADERGARAIWTGSDAVKGGQLATLGDSPRFYAHLAAAFDQVCHSFVAADDMPLDALGGFLDQVLAHSDRA